MWMNIHNPGSVFYIIKHMANSTTLKSFVRIFSLDKECWILIMSST